MTLEQSKSDNANESIGRQCPRCGDHYFVTTRSSPDGAGRRGCGCPVTIVPTTDDDEDDVEPDPAEVEA